MAARLPAPEARDVYEALLACVESITAAEIHAARADPRVLRPGRLYVTPTGSTTLINVGLLLSLRTARAFGEPPADFAETRPMPPMAGD